MIRCKVAVTFEFETRPPATWREVVEGGSAETVSKHAIRQARKTLHPIGWTSMVCCILERLDTTPDSPVDSDGEGLVLAGETNASPDDLNPAGSGKEA